MVLSPVMLLGCTEQIGVLCCLCLLSLCATGDIKGTRMVIYGALLGVLDPVLTLAAAGARESDGTRIPNETMMREIAANKPGGSGEDEGSSSSSEGSSSLGMQQSKVSFEAARGLKDKKRLELAGEHISDHAVTLAALKVCVGGIGTFLILLLVCGGALGCTHMQCGEGSMSVSMRSPRPHWAVHEPLVYV
jgi:hypothetical protein